MVNGYHDIILYLFHPVGDYYNNKYTTLKYVKLVFRNNLHCSSS